MNFVFNLSSTTSFYPLVAINPVIPKVGDRIRFQDKVPNRILGTVVKFDGSIIEVHWDSSAKYKYDINYYIQNFMIVCDPNNILKEIL